MNEETRALGPSCGRFSANQVLFRKQSFLKRTILGKSRLGLHIVLMSNRRYLVNCLEIVQVVLLKR